MNEPKINCHECGADIPLSQLASEQIETERAQNQKAMADLKSSFGLKEAALKAREESVENAEQENQKSLAAERGQLQKQIEIDVRKDMQSRLDDAEKRVAAKDERLKQAEQLELESRKRMADADEKSRLADLEAQRRFDKDRVEMREASARQEQALRKQLADREAELDAAEKLIPEKVAAEREELSKTIRAEVGGEMTVRLSDAERQLAEKDERLKKAEVTELESRKRIAEADEKIRQADLAVQRQLDTERDSIREKALCEKNEEEQRKLAEKDKVIEQMTNKIEVLHRQADSKSQQLQGELEELNVYNRLKEAFPHDEVVRTERGRNGADIELRVKSPSGKIAGTVLIEVKDTQNFDRKWPGKLKEDMQTHQAVTGVIVSRAMPADIDTFSQRDGIWISRINVVVPLLSALRCEVLGIFRERNITALSDSAKDRVFDYLTSAEFARHISSLVDNHQAIYDSIALQKKQLNKRINEQLHALDNMFVGISNVYNDLGLRVGGSLKPVQGLEVDDMPDESVALPAAENDSGPECKPDGTAAVGSKLSGIVK